MGWVAFEMAMRGAAVAVFLLLAVLFVRDGRRSLTTRLGAWLTFAGAAYVALIAVDALGQWHWWRVPLHLLSLSAPGAFWLFAASWFDDDFELRPLHWVFVLAVVVIGFASNYLYWVKHIHWFGFSIGWRLGSLIAIGLALRAALRGRGNDLIESRRRMRMLISVVIAAVILWIVISEIGVRGWPPPLWWRVMNAGGMLAFALAVGVAILGWRDPALLAAPPKAVGEKLADADDSALLAQLDAEMAHERLYRQDGLTITAVAARLGVPEYRLRRAINRGLGARNFNAYLNGLRLREAADALADVAQREVPVLTIALDAGFGSLAPFNRAFRETFCCTPTEYRAKTLAD
jgi:AraC-like DNA-binding protein